MTFKTPGDCCKKFTKFFFSHIGLCGMVALYCVAGGFIFEHLEKKNEEEICYESLSEYQPMEVKTLSSTMKIFQDYGIVATNDTLDMIEAQLLSVLQTFRNNTLAIGYDGSDCSMYDQEGGPTHAWSWSGSLMFSVTVVTTIGYGNIAPKTVWGRLVCIAYAVLGIPLMLLCLANLGDVLADIFRFIYSKICCCGCCRNAKRKQQQDQMPMESITGSKVINANEMKIKSFEKKEDKQTIITGSVPPLGTEFSSLPTESSTDDNNSRPSTASSTSSSHSKARLILSSSRSTKIVPLDFKAVDQNRALKTEPVIYEDDDSEDDEDLEEKKITVPLTVTMFVIGGYIFGGAMLFGLWEGWDTLQSAYFCFITLSTIGFGDVVPGTDYSNPQAQAKLILGSAYVLFGMAILSMCFALMQEEIIAKCRWVGQKLGILEKSDD